MKDPFLSFIWAGYECTSALTAHRRLNMIQETRHDQLIVSDYRNLKRRGIYTVREGLSWSRVDQGHGRYDFSFYLPILKAGTGERIQQVWDLNHFDYPEWLDPLSSDFVQAFTEYGIRAVKFLRTAIKGPLYIAPINEISFFAWISADQGHWAPFLKGSHNGLLLKKNLVRATTSLIKAVRKQDDAVLFIHIDPFMRRLAREPSNQLARNHVKEFNDIIRFEAWDMLMGKKDEDLGGDPSLVDYIGVNYYFHNQEYVISVGKNAIRHIAMPFMSGDRIPFRHMMKDVYERYNKPIIITETGSYGNKRMKWWRRILDDIRLARLEGFPVHGICAYPVLDRLDSSGFLLPKSGLWDFKQTDQTAKRIPHRTLLPLIGEYQSALGR